MSYNIWCWQHTDALEPVITFWSEDQIAKHTNTTLPSLNTANLPNYGQLSLADTLPKPLYQFLHNSLQQHPSVVLRLCQQLPNEWQQFPWEYLTNQGEPLNTRLMVVRFSPPLGAIADDCKLLQKQGETLCVNLLPDKDVPTNLYTHKTIYWEYTNALNTHPLDAYNMLLVLAHGAEDISDTPLLDEQKNPYTLPNKTLPNCVILLVCGNTTGNMLFYAKTLLDRGVKTVIAAMGQLDAKQSMTFFAEFYPRWLQGEPIDTLLYDARQNNQQHHGSKRLLLLGEGALRHPAYSLPTAEQPD
jgi:hypothetical protein